MKKARSGRCGRSERIIPRAKVKELPFAFAEDLKGERAGGSAKESGEV